MGCLMGALSVFGTSLAMQRGMSAPEFALTTQGALGLLRFEVTPIEGVLLGFRDEQALPLRKALVGVGADGVLVDLYSGAQILGCYGESEGVVAPERLSPLRVPTGRFGAEATTHIEFFGSLPTRTLTTTRFHMFEHVFKVFDNEGTMSTLALMIVEHSQMRTWSYFFAADRNPVPPKVLAGKGQWVFDGVTGELIGGHSGKVGLLWPDLNRPALGMTVDFTSLREVDQEHSEVRLRFADGRAGKGVQGYNISHGGQVSVSLGGGMERAIGQIVTANHGVARVGSLHVAPRSLSHGLGLR